MNMTEAYELAEGEERVVRLYHARKSGIFIAQTFKYDGASRALASATAEGPEEALTGLAIQYDENSNLVRAIGLLLSSLKERNHVARRASKLV